MAKDREDILALLAREEFDLLVIGGGATGLGTALDAATRGLKVALAERGDFAEGTSGRSTKLIHGGVRYLEKAVRNLDRSQYDLVREGLKERRIILNNAPHLAHPFTFLTPVYNTLEIPYVWAGLKLYDLMAGGGGLGASRFTGPGAALKAFPQLSAENLKGSVLYRDGQFNDSRMAVALAQTAEERGAAVANHLEITGFVKTSGKIRAAAARDKIDGGEFTIRAKCVVNATGPFADRIRKLANPEAEPFLTVSTGIHIALHKRFAPEGVGLLIPKTEDGRVLFVIPWEGGVIAGSTDDKAEISDHPRVTEEEISYLLRHLGCYLQNPPGRGDVLSAWSGLRPLVAPQKGTTEDIVREHRIFTDESGLVTIAGGKWTSYRRMAAQTVDYAAERFALPVKGPSTTGTMVLIGSRSLDPGGTAKLEKLGLPPETAAHLHRSYGDRAKEIAALTTGELWEKLHPAYPYIKAEVCHAAREEYLLKPEDFLARRLPLALLDTKAAITALPEVAELLGKELGWNQEKTAGEIAEAAKILGTAL